MVTLNMATPEVSGIMVPDGILKTRNIDNYEEHTFNPAAIDFNIMLLEKNTIVSNLSVAHSLKLLNKNEKNEEF